jgi:hypothetical protein
MIRIRRNLPTNPEKRRSTVQNQIHQEASEE